MMKLKVIKLEKTCFVCPAQWVGQLEDGRMIYIRYRFGWLSIRVSIAATSDVAEAIRGEEIMGKQCGGQLDSTMRFSDLFNLSRDLINYGEIKAD